VLLAISTPLLAANFVTDDYPASSGVRYDAPGGPEVILGNDQQVESGNPFLDDRTVRLQNVTIWSNGSTTVQVDQFEGEWTNVSQMDVTQAGLSIDPDDKQQVSVGGDADTLRFRDVSTADADDGRTDLIYGGASGSTDLTVRNVAADAKIAAVDLDTGEQLAVAQSDGNGTVTLTGLPNSEHRVDLQTKEGGDPVISNASPDGENLVRTANLTVDINDSDFPDDTVTVEFYGDGEHLNTQNVTANGTVSYEWTNVSGGQHTWHVEATDDYGGTEVSDDYTFGAAISLYIHNGSNVSQLVDNETVEIEMFSTSGDYRDTRTTSDGTIVFSDVPDEQIMIKLNASNFSNREMIINSPYARPSRHTILYESNDSATFEQCFSLDNRGAGFSPDQTWLIMQAYIDGQWRDTGGGYFGAANVRCLSMQDGSEYRLVVEDDSNRRSLGGYTGDRSFEDQVIALTVEGVSLTLDRGGTYRWEVDSENNDDGTGSIVFNWVSQEATVEDLSVVVYEQGNRSNELDNVDVVGDVGSYSVSFEVPENQTNVTWVVEWQATVDGEEESGSDVVSIDQSGTVLMDLPDEFRKVVVGGFLILVGGIFGFVHAPFGAFIVASTSGILSILGLLDIPEMALFTAMGIGAAALVAAKAGRV
jgi:hypothetical protein